MSIRISKKGVLEIDRGGGIYVEQLCKYSSTKRCGERCPDFWYYEDIQYIKICEDKILKGPMDRKMKDNPNNSIEDDLDNINLKLDKRGN